MPTLICQLSYPSQNLPLVFLGWWHGLAAIAQTVITVTSQAGDGSTSAAYQEISCANPMHSASVCHCSADHGGGPQALQSK